MPEVQLTADEVFKLIDAGAKRGRMDDWRHGRSAPPSPSQEPPNDDG